MYFEDSYVLLWVVYVHPFVFVCYEFLFFAMASIPTEYRLHEIR